MVTHPLEPSMLAGMVFGPVPIFRRAKVECQSLVSKCGSVSSKFTHRDNGGVRLRDKRLQEIPIDRE